MSDDRSRNDAGEPGVDAPPPLRAWMDEQPARERDELVRTWALAETARPAEPSAADTDAAWDRLAAELDAPAEPSSAERRAADRPAVRRASHSRRRWTRWAGAAALLVVAAALGLMAWRAPVTVEAGPGAPLTATLPDGSTVDLSGGSALTYTRPLLPWGLVGGARAVRLEGEAFFEVEEGTRPFRVETFNAAVQVLGTRFNVRALGRETQVALASGRVRFTGEGASEGAVTLQPGQQSRVVGPGGAPSAPVAADLDAVTAWRTGGFAFTAAPMGVVLDEVERRFNASVEASPALRQDSISLYRPHTDDARSVLGDLCAAAGCDVRETPGGFVLEAF